ncbi:MAG: FMN-binding negative transcriptional regulator [Bacteroidota bacterium]
MYKFSYFTEEDPGKILGFIRENSFAVITGFGADYPVATHLPLEIETTEEGKLLFKGHLMKNTDHHKAFANNENVLVVFNGPHTYVSASWYESPQVASTWNYMAVHAKGKISFTDDAGTLEAIRSITTKYEGTESAASFDRIPTDYINKMLKAIVGFSIEVENIDNVFKLSQNHGQANRQSITTHLKEQGDAHAVAIAQEMDKHFQ